jgi:DNA-binding XRE family transcriptional regulator
MTQDKAAQKAEITQGYLSLIITGKRRPDWDLAKVLAEMTKTEVALWMEGDEMTKRRAICDA